MKKKKTKKIILAIIVAIISFISVFSCFKGKYTPEPVLMPVNEIRKANPNSSSVVEAGTFYPALYFNQSTPVQTMYQIINDFDFTLTLPGSAVGSSADSISVYPIKAKEITAGTNYSVLCLAKTIKGETITNEIIVLGTGSFSIPYTMFSATQDYTGGWIESYSKLVLDTGTNTTMEFGGNTFPVGDKNNLLVNYISSSPFLFQGTSNSLSWTSSGLDNPNNIQNIYFNTNLTNQTIKNILNTYIGTTEGIDIFNYLTGGVLVRCHVINNSTNAFIEIIGGSTTLYKWIYNPNSVTGFWYGIDPSIIDNGNVITSPQGNALNGFNIYELRSLFSSSNDFVEQSSGDSYEQGYQDGYQAGYSAGETAGYNSGYSTGYDNGYSSGVNNVTTNPNDYNLYTYNQYQGNYANGYNAGEEDGYNRGYLDGLDDGANTNISFQYIESVLTLIGNFLNIEVLPGIKLSYALGIIIILTIISIIKMVVK